MNTIKLKCAAVQAGTSILRISREHNIFNADSTTYNKLHGKTAYTVPEVIKTARALNLSKDQIIEIFFDELLAEWSSNESSISDNR